MSPESEQARSRKTSPAGSDGSTVLTAFHPRQFEKEAIGDSHDDLAVSYDKEVLPARYDESRSFGFHPVYPNLRDILRTAERQPNAAIAHALATCSAYSYSDAYTLSMIMTRIGLERNRCYMISESVDAMLIDSTAFLVESEDGTVVVLSYRGTQPLSLLNWMVSLNTTPERLPVAVAGANGRYDVHAGFYRNVRATRHKVVDRLTRALHKGESVVKDVRADKASLKPLRALYITGHSLGGAMAALMAVMLCSDEKYEPIADKLKAVYTFAQPMIGSPLFADACQREPFLANQVLRYVYEKDVVPGLPPKVCGPFAHFGREFKFRHATWTQQQTVTRQAPVDLVLPAALPLITRQFPVLASLGRLLPYSLENHLPEHYVTSLAPNEACNEFGEEH
jgi:predicted lipase